MDATENRLHTFWENNFQQKKEMWGQTPSNAASKAAILFQAKQINTVLIPGFGYGRNARPFLDNNMKVTGIEISETAISLVAKEFANQIQKIYHGSVEAMPFDRKYYDGIFCYSLIHLLDQPARIKLIRDCYQQLSVGGYMIFVAVSMNFPSFGKGRRLSKNRYETIPGVTLYFYDHLSIQEEFGKYGLAVIEEVAENGKDGNPRLPAQYWYIVCKK